MFYAYSRVTVMRPSIELVPDLQNSGVRCYLALREIQGGRRADRGGHQDQRPAALILSMDSMNSEWVKTEIASARQKERRENRQVLFPIGLPFEVIRYCNCFDADTGKDSAREIRESFIPDFSNWKDHDSYQQAFQRLLSDLNADAGVRG